MSRHNRERRQKPVVVIELTLPMSNDVVRNRMTVMKAARERGVENVVCVISGYGDDARELWEIPEVRAFCRRLVALGFISYLDFTTAANPDAPPTLRAAFGAAEVWLIAEGRYRAGMPLTRRMVDEIAHAVGVSNAVANETCGPFRDPLA